MSHRILLAYSGGLDTSYCVIYLKAQGHEVHTVTADTGGFSDEEKARIEKTAIQMGSSSHKTIDARQQLFDGYLRYLIAGNVLRGGLYPLSVSAERVCQAKAVVDHARVIGATALAHGSTGAGNDQVRFDVAFRALASDLALLAPIRDLAPSRQEEWDFLKEHGFEFPQKTATYSVNEGMWGTSVGGKETHDPWQHLPEEAYPGGAIDPAKKPEVIQIGFEKGIPVSLYGKPLNPVTLIQILNKLGSSYGIGRGIHLGDTIMGIKGRVGFEAPAAHLLINAHRELEKLVLSGKQLFWKESLGNLYGGFMHEGHFFDPICRDLEAFLESSQAVVTGEVRLCLFPRAFEVQGVSSPYSLMRKDLASYGEGTALWSGAEAAGFTKIFGVPQQLARLARMDLKN
jgi:argininosuccinate synthase